MLPHTSPGVPNAALSAVPSAQHLNAYPIIMPGSSAAKGTRGHTRRRASPRARRTGCPCAFSWWQPVRPEAHHPHKLPPEETPRPIGAPKRNASSQERLRPRKLRVIRSSLLASRIAAACRLRQSCRRDRVPRLPCHEPGVPRHFAVAFRGCAATTPAKRRAIFRQQTYPTDYQDPHTRRLLDPAYSLRPKQKGVRFAHVHLLHTPGAFGPSRGRLVARAAARGSRA